MVPIQHSWLNQMLVTLSNLPNTAMTQSPMKKQTIENSNKSKPIHFPKHNTSSMLPNANSSEDNSSFTLLVRSYWLWQQTAS
ncbi:hypothetical protein CEXT_127741 [Caerostris extrusa]|uniref:Uncharacterized protein n=1 Tax=Caerostris extrusa TaxID=172846 RepID=A0AAV4S434_CAEEX|nr:hypothetical protein CEXT_127741 [Caerostris extrusa]